MTTTVYALACTSSDALIVADRIGLNPLSRNYATLTDPRFKGRYLVVTVDNVDGMVLHGRHVKASEIADLYDTIPLTYID